MVTIGVDPHKQTHTAAAVDDVGRELSNRTERAEQDGFGELLVWARKLAPEERIWVIEDCRQVSGPFERFLLDHGESVARLAPRLMADARHGVRERGKSDPIDALAVARAALREGSDTLPTARLAGPELEIRLLVVHRERLINARTRLINELRWQLHDLWPDYRVPKRALTAGRWQRSVTQRLAGAEPTARVRIARDEIRRIRDLTSTIDELAQQLSGLVADVAPQLLLERGIGALIAAKLIGEIAGIGRFRTDAKLGRLAACAPIPVSSGRTDRHRLDPGGNRQLNHAMLSTGETYRELGGDFFTNRDPDAKPGASSPSSNASATTSRSERRPRQPERTFPVRQKEHLSCRAPCRRGRTFKPPVAT